MATVKYYGARASDMGWPPGEGQLLAHDDGSAEITALMAPDIYLFLGSGFVYENDALVGGTVTEIVYKSGENDVFRITDIAWDASLGLPFFGGGDVIGGNDVVTGSRWRDDLGGGSGDDIIRGGQGEDYILGGPGNDILRGGGKSDVFVFAIGHGSDRILDFDPSGSNRDILAIQDVDNIHDLNVEQRQGDVIIEFNASDRVVLRHVDLEDLSLRNFDFQ